MYHPSSYTLLVSLLRQRPAAIAGVKGSDAYPKLCGEVLFYETRFGVFAVADIMGLPDVAEACGNRYFGFHIHTGESCNGSAGDPFAMAQGHYNPQGCPHPSHAGDLPPLLSVRGRAFSAFLTDRFTVAEIVGRTVIIHGSPDDFKTQPGGDAGERIACGVIRGIS